MADETADQPAATPEPAGTDQPAAADASAAPALPPGYILDPLTGQVRAMTFMERARGAAAQAAKVGAVVGREAVKVGAEVGKEAAKVGAEVGSKAATTIRDPATQARARSALKKAKRGFTTALERIDPRILADVVVKATSLQEKANASLRERRSAYRIGEITIGASFPPSIQFSIERVDDPELELHDSSVLLAKGIGLTEPDGDGAAATIVGLDGTAVDEAVLDELADEE